MCEEGLLGPVAEEDVKEWKVGGGLPCCEQRPLDSQRVREAIFPVEVNIKRKERTRSSEDAL